MSLLIAGLILFLGIHSIAIFAPGLRERVRSRLGDGPWKGFYSLVSLLGFVLPWTYGLMRLLNRFYPMRVAPEGERQGLDLHELGAGAYPDFVSHNDDFLQR